MSKATYEGFIALHKRPFIITRSAFAGTSAYATTWTGDNQSLWDHLRLTIPQQCNLSLSGYQMIGNDIGGFGGDTTKELLLRWIALGVANPLMGKSLALRAEENALHLPYMKALFLYSDATGQGKMLAHVGDVISRLRKTFSQLEAVQTHSQDELIARAKGACGGKVDALIVAGGDGTFHHVRLL